MEQREAPGSFNPQASPLARIALAASAMVQLQSLSVIVIILAAGVPALAGSEQPGATAVEPSPEGVQVSLTDSKAAQRQASQSFREGRFVEAADLLRFAYRGDPRPVLLFNAGQAYRKAERALDAKEMYEQFVTVAPEHSLVPETRGYIKDMEALLSTQQRAKQVALELEDRLEKTESHAKQAALALEKERERTHKTTQALTQTQAQLERERQRNRPIHRRPWFWGVLTGAAAATVVGIGLGVFFGTRGRTDGGNVVIEE